MKNKRIKLVEKSSEHSLERQQTYENLNDFLYNKEKILKVLINIYYYEKDEDKFKNPEKVFYLIKYEWMEKLKNITSYQEVSKILKNITCNKKPITYDSLKNLENDIIFYLKKYNIKIIGENFEEDFKELSNAVNFKPDEINFEKINNSPFYYIIPEELKAKFEECIFNKNEIIMEYIYNISAEGNQILIKLINERKYIIKICSTDNKFKTIIKYIIKYKNDYIMNSEINSLKKNIEKYIKERGCQPNIPFIQQLKNKQSKDEIGQLNILENNGKEKNDRENKSTNNKENILKKLFSRNKNNNLKKEYHSVQNSPEKKAINIIPNNKKNESKNNTLRSINNNNNENNNFKIYCNNDDNNNNNNNNNNNKIKIHHEEEKNIPIFKKSTFDKQEPQKDVIFKKYDEQRVPNNFNNINFLEKNKDENIKYDNILKQMEKQFDNVNKKLNEVMTYNKQLELNLNKKMDKIIENQNNINQLTKKLNECMGIIEQLKEENKKLKEEKEMKIQKEKEKENNNNLNQHEFRIRKLIQTNMVLDKIKINKNNFKKIPVKKEIVSIKLINRGQAPFINPVILCLFYTESLSNHFKYLNKINPNLKLAFSFQELIKQLSENNEKDIDPKNFIDTISEIESEKDIDIIYTNDSIYDFLKFILNQLHEELKEVMMNQNNSKNQQFKFQNAFNIIKENEKSIITDLFQIENMEIIQCTSKNVRNPTYKFEKILYLSFDLRNEELIKEKLSIQNCLVKMRQKLVQRKKEYCEKCEQYCEIIHNHKFSICPKILLVMLNYEDEPNYIDSNLEEKLDITNFTKIGLENNIQNQIYNLYGIISKIGNNYKNKYIASCRNSVGGKWYRFDDENIQIVENINNAVNHEIPIMLFYSKVEN